MNSRIVVSAAAVIVILGAFYLVFGMPRVADAEIPTSEEAIARGEYLVHAGGCISCHQLEDAEGMSGGYEIESPFGGTFYAPNITPDGETGLGGWTGRDFLLALKHGRTPDGSFYYPAFPYRSYAGMTDEDALAIAAYIMAQPPIRNEVPDNDLPAWQFRWLMAGWNIAADWLEGEYPELPDDPEIQRGAYLARHLGHCGECHTPRNGLGMMQLGREFGGSDIVGAQINPEGLSRWTEEDFIGFLELGMTASFDFVSTEMLEVIEDNTSHLSDEDKQALTAFFTREPAPAEDAEAAGE